MRDIRNAMSDDLDSTFDVIQVALQGTKVLEVPRVSREVFRERFICHNGDFYCEHSSLMRCVGRGCLVLII